VKGKVIPVLNWVLCYEDAFIA